MLRTLMLYYNLMFIKIYSYNYQEKNLSWKATDDFFDEVMLEENVMLYSLSHISKTCSTFIISMGKIFWGIFIEQTDLTLSFKS